MRAFTALVVLLATGPAVMAVPSLTNGMGPAVAKVPSEVFAAAFGQAASEYEVGSNRTVERRGGIPNSIPAQDNVAGLPRQRVRADGHIELLPSRVEVRCRFSYFNTLRTFKQYRVFMDTGYIDYPDWCVTLRSLVRSHCFAELGRNPDIKVEWGQCYRDAKDLLWARGTIATFALTMHPLSTPVCVYRAILDSVPGSLVDWMGHFGCYEAYGFEIEL
ncbi:hypothetical protein CDD83_4725 [Cordyceps sp. RAO-2017]|nr:hypothetical protein CDD83_4725 [Cordyceps sp. RAO-2017]